MYRNSLRLFCTSVVCVCVHVRAYQCVKHESIFHLQITSVEMGTDQLVPYVCQGLGSLHVEQQETLASVCCFTLPINNREPKILSFVLFHTSYLHIATSTHTIHREVWWCIFLILLHSHCSCYWDWKLSEWTSRTTDYEDPHLLNNSGQLY